MRIITRAEWGARPATSRRLIDTPTPKLYLHHAAGAILPGDDRASTADYSRIRSIQNYHMDVRGWSDIAYSFLVDPDGYVFEGRGAGVAGGHTAGQNTVSHAICVMGNYDEQPVDADLIAHLVEFVRHGTAKGWWPATFTGGHRDAPDAATSCPGDNLYRVLPVINATLLGQQEDDVAIEPAWLNTLEALHKAFDGKILTSRTAILDALLEDAGKNIITRDELNTALASVGDGAGLNDAQVRTLIEEVGAQLFVEKGKPVTIRGAG